jgi:hypothetical protein
VALKPIALVGKIGREQKPDGTWVHGWNEYDIFRRLPDGSIHHGHHAQMILDGELFQPNGASLYESPRFNDRYGIDPRTLDPISLDPPDMTDEEKRIVPLAQAINEVKAAVSDIGSNGGYTEENLRAILANVHRITEVE